MNGSELRMLVTTRRQWSAGHRIRMDRLRTWLVIANLDRDPIEGVRVIGPILSLDKERSYTGLDPGEQPFLDREPRIEFDSSGNVMRVAGRSTDRLEVMSDGPRWRRAGAHHKIPDSQGMNAEADSLGRDLHAQLEDDGNVRVYEQLSGNAVADGWLEKAFADLQSHKDLLGGHCWITNDAKFLVMAPEDGYQTEPIGGKEETRREFTLGGKTYRRFAFGIWYARPSIEPRLFERIGSTPSASYSVPLGAYSIDERLCLFQTEESALRLRATNGEVLFQYVAPKPADWMTLTPPQHVPERGELVLNGLQNHSENRDLAGDIKNPRIRVGIWQYRKGTLRRVEMMLKDLFDVREAEYVPKVATPVSK